MGIETSLLITLPLYVSTYICGAAAFLRIPVKSQLRDEDERRGVLRSLNTNKMEHAKDSGRFTGL